MEHILCAWSEVERYIRLCGSGTERLVFLQRARHKQGFEISLKLIGVINVLRENIFKTSASLKVGRFLQWTRSSIIRYNGALWMFVR